MARNERHLCVQERRLKLFALKQEVVRTDQLWRHERRPPPSSMQSCFRTRKLCASSTAFIMAVIEATCARCAHAPSPFPLTRGFVMVRTGCWAGRLVRDSVLYCTVLELKYCIVLYCIVVSCVGVNKQVIILRQKVLMAANAAAGGDGTA